MSRRIEIELTSSRDDGSWTWRAAGAREPRGALPGDLLPSGAKVGDVLRVDADFFVDGIEITAVLPPKGGRVEPERLEIIGAPVKDEQLVTSTLTSKSRDDGGRGPRRDRGDRPERGERRDRPEREKADRGERGDKRRPDGGRRERPAAAGDRPTRPERPDRPPRTPRPEREVDERPKPKRLRAGKAHRNALLESLPGEQRPVAEQLVLGGLPAVRQALDKQNEERKAAGESEVKAGPFLHMAEELLPKVRAAEWHDRAEAALADVDELDLRDLRSVVTASDAAGRDDESRQLASTLREALTTRVDKEHSAWLAELTTTLGDGRIVRALRISSRPPKAGAPLPKDLATKLTEATSAALTSDASPDRWAAVLDALAFAPVRRKVVPASLPATLADDLRQVIARLASRLPEIAHIFAVEADPTAARARPDRPKRAKKAAKRAPKKTPDRTAAAPAETVAEVESAPVEPAIEEAFAADPTPPDVAVTEADQVAAPEPVAGPEPVAEPEPVAAPEPVVLTPVVEVDSVEEAIGTGTIGVAPGASSDT
jgi:hypothetical protein